MQDLWLLLAVALFFAQPTFGEVLTIDASAAAAAPSASAFHMGTSRNLEGHEITVNSTCLLRDGKPWLPVMGEFQYSRYPAAEWREELLKMKAGGVDLVATYVFWIHHEEIEGQWDWTGQRDLRAFLHACKEVALPVILRIGPWDHGEVRHGGFPDWLVEKGWKLRSDDEQYMARVRLLYQQIADQSKGMLWKEGGPAIGVQVENEFHGRGEHLMHLKTMARDVGLDVPIYTRTGWPNLSSPVPFGEILPLFGAYAEGFWDRDLKSMPGKYWQAFFFRPQRTDNAVATDQLGARQSKDELDAQQYPYLTCELGGGMMSSYHRRIKIEPMDVLAVALCKIGSGSNLPGYYVYHGGTNPDSKTGITLQEAQATKMTNYNDMPVKNYDFQAPLGAFGQVRDSYFLLQRLHSFLRDWGSELAMMPPVFPRAGAKGRDDAETLRWCVRTNGTSGFLFVNNYQRGLAMPERKEMQFEIKLRDQTVHIPSKPVTLPADSAFLWPFNLDLGGEQLIYATAQPISRVDREGETDVTFAQTPDVASEFAFATGTHIVKPGKESRLQIETKSKRKLNIIVLDAPKPIEAKLSGVAVTFEPVSPAGPLREIKTGSQRVAEAPTDKDFDHAAIWRIKLPNTIEPRRHLLLRIHYTGDVARLYLGDKLIADDFYNGDPMELGIDRFAPDITKNELLLKILPLQKGAPIALPKSVKPDFGDQPSIAAVKSVDVIEAEQVTDTR